MAFTYRGKTALITGASGGIGAAFAAAAPAPSELGCHDRGAHLPRAGRPFQRAVTLTAG